MTYKNLFSNSIRVSLKTAASFLSAYPASAVALEKVARGLKRAEHTREKYAESEGTQIPPLMIVSTTEECNLACKGCYARERGKRESLSGDCVSKLLNEASELGVSIVMLAGGEPLLSGDWLEEMSKHSDMLGLVFTNGTLLNEQRIAWFMEHRHMIPVLSIEGGAAQTDARRGEGIFAKVTNAMDDLRKSGVPFGISITVTSQNIDHVMADDFSVEYLEKGCRLFFYIEYVPAAANTESLILSKDDKKRLSAFTVNNAKKHPALFIAFPGDETPFGGCLAAGRGFIHVGADGAVEPCPFAPFSDTNIKNNSLKDALDSPLLSKIREHHHLLIEGNGGCALWNHREWFI